MYEIATLWRFVAAVVHDSGANDGDIADPTDRRLVVTAAATSCVVGRSQARSSVLELKEPLTTVVEKSAIRGRQSYQRHTARLTEERASCRTNQTKDNRILKSRTDIDVQPRC